MIPQNIGFVHIFSIADGYDFTLFPAVSTFALQPISLNRARSATYQYRNCQIFLCQISSGSA